MPRFVVLLRGVNVGKGNRIAMARFRLLLEALGYTGVRSLLNSGNAIFDSTGRSAARHAEAIAGVLRDQLGISVATFVTSAADFERILAQNPIVIPAAEHSRLLVVFGRDPGALAQLELLQALVQPAEQFAVTEQAAYLYCPDGLLQSKVGSALLGKAGRELSTRNWATTLKLGDMVRSGAA